ncbi:MAG: tRNA pseudouridine(38-40) synthase TruA [Xanthomonadales bacterium]|nr:tRNA pseudouridine(38-40) synthase TruA [Xanthomonadales bacterium]MCB1772847.1 tRNA pseudouridine(38-40) synthase TruA [Gammaproteobacteria bacterium]
MNSLQRIALGVEYDGTDYYGWQIQAQSPTVQEVLQQALAQVADHPIEVVCAGRTDTGVHGRCQVVHFDTRAPRSERSWVLGANSNLPDTVAVRWAQQVPESFHARFSARRRSYRYRLLNRWVRPGLGGRYLAWERRPLALAPMQAAATLLLGEHDFSAFRTVHCQAPSPVRTLYRLTITANQDEFVFEAQANGFLHHMVRNLVGSLLVVGRGEQPPEWVAEVLRSGDRCQAGPTAPSAGLCFLGPAYPLEWGLPPEVSLPEAGEGSCAPG